MQTNSYLEAIPLKLRPGTITVSFDRVHYRTQDGRGQATLLVQAEVYLRRLQTETDLETLILDLQTSGHGIDYHLLRKTVLALFHGGCLKNGYELEPFIAALDSPPLKEVEVSQALFRAPTERIERPADLILFAGAVFVLAAFVALLSPLGEGVGSHLARLWWSVFLYPSAALSLTALASYAVAAFAKVRPTLGARLSPLGLHLEIDSRFAHARPIAAVTVPIAMTLILPSLTWMFLQPLTVPLSLAGRLEPLIRNLAPLLFMLACLPGSRTPLTHARFELKRRGLLHGPSASAPLTGAFTALAITGLCAAFAFAAMNVINGLDAIRFLHRSSAFARSDFLYLVMIVMTTFWSVLAVVDLIDGLESLANDNELFSPLERSLTRLLNLLHQGRARHNQNEIHAQLSANLLFQSLPDDLRAELAKSARIQKVSAGTRLIRTGSRSNELFIVINGMAGVYRTKENATRSELVIRLGSGSIFGESGFFLGQQRTADVVALQPTRLIRIPQPPRLRRMETDPTRIQDAFRKKIWASQALASSSLFKDLPSEVLFTLLNTSEILTFPPGHILIREGEPADALWICVQGQASVFVDGEPRPGISSGAVLGEIALLWNTARTATVRIKTESIYIKVEAATARRLFSQNINLAARLQKVGAARLEQDRVA